MLLLELCIANCSTESIDIGDLNVINLTLPVILRLYYLIVYSVKLIENVAVEEQIFK